MVVLKMRRGDLSKASASLLAEFAKIAFELGLEDAKNNRRKGRAPGRILSAIGVLSSTKRERSHVTVYASIYAAGFCLGVINRGK